ncbi:hypothetical protein D3C80_560540 [compost metagenome]
MNADGHLRDVLSLQSMFFLQAKNPIERGCKCIAAGIELELVSLHWIENARNGIPAFDKRGRVIGIRCAIEDSEKTLVMFEGSRARGKTVLCESHRQQGVAISMPDNEWFRHCPEVRLYSGRKRRGNSKRHCGLLISQAAYDRRSSDRTE